ncbi:MAG TPA: HD domain-containing protein [Gemmatimonadaceae bacterium]|nr:HD domain-containing protein [Gemmatimonadaceae bacterium]
MTSPADRILQQLAFVRELDRLKTVLRRTSLIDRSRRENSAEHTWHLTAMALAFAEHAPAGTDLLRVLEMLVIHDVVEIDAGDTFAFDAAANLDKAARETAAAERLFGLLPHDVGERMRARWEEFEEGASPASRFANALDRLQALILNTTPGDGGTWAMHGVSRTDVLARMAPIRDGAPALWAMVETVVDRAVAVGHVSPD